MSSTLLANALLAASLILALGFHRHRAAQCAALLWLLLAGAGSDDPRLAEGALRFVPWLLLLCAALPEARLFSRRHAALLLLSLFLFGVTVDAPQRMFELLRDAAAWPLGGLAAPQAAAALVLLAAAVCLLRWALRGQPLELGLFVVLLLAGIGCVRGAELPVWLAASAASCLFAVLYASYRMAFIDPLTGLPNRRALDETLARLSGSYTLAMIDVDHFKQFNDVYGHESGDRVLHAVAQGLRRHAGGAAFRYGGEEFCVVYGGSRAAKAADLLEQARAAIEAQQVVVAAPPRGRRKAAGGATDKAVAVTISAGCAPRSDQHRAAAEVLEAADRALYRAKQRGRNRVVAA
jgi:diguanylate cyclase (GGDEF)-like protein